jgi:hypothetical protein
MELTTVGTALDLVSKASKALDSMRERAKPSNDAALKENISKLYDDLDLKAIIVRTMPGFASNACMPVIGPQLALS